jgi:ATP-dependent Clp protease ATP-binding subunit ClpA
MFDRFTDRARKVMGLALQEARRLRHDYIGTEHILLGILMEGSGVAQSVLRNLDADVTRVRHEVERLLEPGPTVPTSAQLPFTPRAKKVLDFALEESTSLGHSYIGTEHLLLGLLREDEGMAAQVLRNLKVKIEDARHETLELLGIGPAERSGTPSAEPLGLTAAASHVLDDARAEAVKRHAGAIDVGHLALALLAADQGFLGSALETLGIPPGPVRAMVRQILDEGDALPALRRR